jgi:undecaprenyl pyrophosphate phosphatase UppP
MLIIVFAFKALTFAWNKSPAKPELGRAKKSAHFDRLSVMPIGIAAAIIGFLFQGIFDHALYNYRIFLMFWIVIGFATLFKFTAQEEATKGEAVSD